MGVKIANEIATQEMLLKPEELVDVSSARHDRAREIRRGTHRDACLNEIQRGAGAGEVGLGVSAGPSRLQSP